MPGFDQNLLFRRFVVVFSWDRSPRFRTIREIERVCTQPATAIHRSEISAVEERKDLFLDHPFITFVKPEMVIHDPALAIDDE